MPTPELPPQEPKQNRVTFHPETGVETRQFLSPTNWRGEPRKRSYTKKRVLVPPDPKAVQDQARKLVTAFFFEPSRVKKILERFEKRALGDDKDSAKVLMEFVDRLFPKPRAEEGSAGVTVVINSPILTKLKHKRTVEGEVLEVRAGE